MKGGDEGWRRKKKKGKRKGRSVARFRPSLSSPPRFVIEGVSSRSENRGALLVSADLKMYPFLSLPLSLVRSIFSSRQKIVNGISNSAFDFYCLPPLFFFVPCQFVVLLATCLIPSLQVAVRIYRMSRVTYEWQTARCIIGLPR